jgi:lactate dehydrogenase-like 2-hydroxyacid dehydrogenase
MLQRFSLLTTQTAATAVRCARRGFCTGAAALAAATKHKVGIVGVGGVGEALAKNLTAGECSNECFQVF